MLCYISCEISHKIENGKKFFGLKLFYLCIELSDFSYLKIIKEKETVSRTKGYFFCLIPINMKNNNIMHFLVRRETLLLG